MAVFEEGNTLFRAEPSHWKGQAGVNHAIEVRDRLINTELTVQTRISRRHSFRDVFHELFTIERDNRHVVQHRRRL